MNKTKNGTIFFKTASHEFCTAQRTETPPQNKQRDARFLFSIGSLLSVSTKMGFTKQIIRAGNGVKPQRGQNVTVHCTGFGKNRDLSQKFWSTKDPGQQPFTFRVGLGEGTLMPNPSDDSRKSIPCSLI